MTEAATKKTEAAPSELDQKHIPPPKEEDSDPDFDDLDDVLDQFSSNTAASKQTSKPAPAASGPGRPKDAAFSSPPLPAGQKPGETEEQFMARLTSEMQNMMTQLSSDPAASTSSPEDLAKMGKELDEFTRKLEAEGVQPQDLLKAILGEETGTQVAKNAENERDRRESQSQSRSPEKPGVDAQASSSIPPRTNFDETIRRTMNKLSTSDQQATQQTNKPKSEDDMLAELLKAMDSSDGGDSEGDLSKMFLGMMEQLTHKDMLYEPMKELNDKYPDWLVANSSKTSAEDMKRFISQQAIVKEIVAKFEEEGYSDDDPLCREYIWERMQRMQTEGSPPDDLIANPFPGMGGMPDVGGGGGASGEDPRCPTQ